MSTRTRACDGDTDLVDLIARKGRVGRHQKMASRRRNERRDDAYEVIVHVTWITQRLRARSHHRRYLSRHRVVNHPRWTTSKRRAHELIRLIKRGRLYVQPISRDPRQRPIVEHNDRIGMVRQPFKRQQRIIRLHDDVALLRIGKDRIRLNKLLGKLVVQPLEYERPKTRTRAAGDRVHEHESLQRGVRRSPNMDEARRRGGRTSSESLPSASRSTISITSSYSLSPDAYPCAQLFPAPPPSFDTNIFSGLYKFAHGELNILLIT